jgi:hypothetical protein
MQQTAGNAFFFLLLVRYTAAADASARFVCSRYNDLTFSCFVHTM